MMPFSVRFTDNFADIEESIRSKIERFGLADDGDFAADVQYIVGSGQLERSAREQDPGFSPWKENDPEYKASKGGLPIGVKTGRMLDPANVFGRMYATRHQIRVLYGQSAAEARRLEAFESTGRKMWGMDYVIKERLMERTREKLRTALHG
jgi:hypothetical protein